MKMLEATKNLLILLRICVAPNGTSKWISFRNIIISVGITLAIFFSFISSAWLTVKFIKNHNGFNVMGFIEVLPFFTGTYTLIVAHRRRDKIESIFEEFQTIYDKCKMPCRSLFS